MKTIYLIVSVAMMLLSALALGYGIAECRKDLIILGIIIFWFGYMMRRVK